jgi:hypothetical protein
MRPDTRVYCRKRCGSDQRNRSYKPRLRINPSRAPSAPGREFLRSTRPCARSLGKRHPDTDAEQVAPIEIGKPEAVGRAEVPRTVEAGTAAQDTATCVASRARLRAGHRRRDVAGLRRKPRRETDGPARSHSQGQLPRPPVPKADGSQAAACHFVSSRSLKKVARAQRYPLSGVV